MPTRAEGEWSLAKIVGVIFAAGSLVFGLIFLTEKMQRTNNERIDSGLRELEAKLEACEHGARLDALEGRLDRLEEEK